jgi:hypothetical protein
MKKILFGILLLCVTLAFTIDKGKLSGVVLFKDAYKSSCQADAGSEIYIVSQSDVKPTQNEDLSWVIGNFQMFKSQYAFQINNSLDPARGKKAQDNFNDAADLTFRDINKFKHLPAVIKVKTNEKGNYSVNLKPGKYFILIISGNVKSNNIAESQGNFEYRDVEIKSAGETILNVNFEKHDMTWIRLITALKGQGC